ncbi:MAG: helix-turn-helix transcriptional regulator [Bacteroidales bacterium]|nr:helix-turn-helix transcriptional regulator [Bacteroidales bacterium]
MAKELINRLKIVLAEEQKSNKWLAEQLGKDEATISKWATNTVQPDLRNLLRIARVMKIDAGRLLNQNYIDKRDIEDGH